MLWGLKPVEPQAVHGLALDRLRRSIHLGLLLPGERMASERRLAEQIGISRVTLREALSVLDAQGYVTIRRGAAGGAFVAEEPDLRRIAAYQHSAQTAAMHRVTEYRDHAEPMAARLAAIRRTPADLKQITGALDALAGAETTGAIRQAEAAFHLSVAAGSGNAFFATSIEDAMALMFLPFPGEDAAAEAEDSLRLRQAVAEAIVTRDEAGAEAGMQAVLAATKARMPRRQAA